MPAPGGLHRSLAETGWVAATPGPVPPGEVCVWRIELAGVSGAWLARCRALLSPDERERAARFRFARDRHCYVITRGSLRKILSASLPGVQPADICFRYSAHGKPTLEGTNTLSFNVSHAGGYALIAVGWVPSLGVDLEAVDRSITVENLVERFFAVPERAAVRALPAALRHEAFFRTWTRKEAFLKAQGEGLSLPLDRFAVTVDFATPVALEWIDWEAERITDWRLHAFTVAEGLPGGLVVRLPTSYGVRYLTFVENAEWP